MSWQDEPMDQARLLERIRQEQAALEAVLAPLDAATLTQPGVYADLSVKDVLAHLAAWQGMEVGWLRTALRGEPVLRYAPGFEAGGPDEEAVTDRLNAHIFAENQGKPLAAVLSDLRTTHRDLLEVVQAIAEDDLSDPHRFDWWDGEPIWTSIAGNSYEHVRQHRLLIESWLAARDSSLEEEQETIMTTLTTFQARPYAGDADLPAITALLNLCDAVDKLDDSYTEDDLRLEFESPELDPARDLRLWEDAEGRLAGFGQIWIPKESAQVDGGLYLRVHPAARGQHLEEEILEWGEARTREAAQEQGKPPVIRCWVREGNYIGPILEGQGLQIVRYFYKMARPLDQPLPEPELPEGFRMIDATQADDSHVERWVEMFNQSFIDHWNHHPLTAENHRHWISGPKYKAERDLVALAPDGTYAAFCFCWIDPDDNARNNRKEGWIDILGTRRGYRKIGLGKAMLLAGMHLLKGEGMDTAVLGVDAENPSGALRLYESVGFASVQTSVTYSKDL